MIAVHRRGPGAGHDHGIPHHLAAGGRHAARVAAVGVTLVAGSVLAGWAFDVAALRSSSPA